MSSKINPRSNRLLLGGGYLALIIGFVIAGVVPCVRGMNAAQRDIRNDQQEIDARMARTQELQDVKARVESINWETRDFSRLVPPNQNLDFLTDLTDQLKQAGMKDISLHNLAETPLNRSMKVPVEVRGKGSFAQLHEFMTRLETMPRLCSVGRLNIDADNAEMSGQVEVQLTLYFYYAKPVGN